MDTNISTYTQRTPEEIIRAMYAEELRMKEEAEKKHVYELEPA